MTVKDQLKILDRKIKQNKTDYDLFRQNAEISALSSGELDKYEYLTKKDLNYKPDPIQNAKFEYSPLGQVFNKGLDSSERQKGLLKRLKNLEDKTDNQLDLIKSQRSRQESIDKFYNGFDREILELQKRAINESIDNITNEDKVFSFKINNRNLKIDRYINLAYFGNLLFKGTIDLKKAIGDQRKLSEIVNELEKKNTRRGHPLSEENKDDIKHLIKNGREIQQERIS